ncbi:MAG TPA: chemotaxis protein CheB [Bacteroidales bacterium]|nr:chemotaxis protein CheB [Bacteroidales bacterium]
MNRKPSQNIISSSHLKYLDFPVVAIGSSAGGLEALELFFSNMPDNTGMAFVLIQHLDPNYKGMMADLIRKVTKMKVIQVSDNLKVKPDSVYVIPPNKNMSILNGRLQLFDLAEVHGLRLPINFFFHSLADDMGENSIGIILSGMGSDGTLGLKSIKERGGLTLVQEPSNAKYDSMPKNAIQSIQVEVVASAGELPGRLISFLKKALPRQPDVNSADFKDKSSLEKIVLLIRSKTGNDFSQYKKSTIYRRVERRMMIQKIDHIAAYVRFLMQNPDETEILFKELLIGATSFFRDPELWHLLTDDILPAYLKEKAEGHALRIWIPACSTGEEAFSYAIVLREVINNLKKSIPVQIFATDLDSGAIEKARKGVYNEGIAGSVSGERLKRFFTRSGIFYKINADIREMVVFAPHNVISDPPFTKVDLISCRNLLIYHEPGLQKALLGVFHYSLVPRGFLILGTSETTGSQAHLFDIVNSRYRIFRKRSLEKSSIAEFVNDIREFNDKPNEKKIPVKSMENIQSLTDKLILQEYSPAGVLVNTEGDIVYLTRRAGKYLEPVAGKANILSMLREGLNPEFPVAFRRASVNSKKVVLKKIKIESDSDPMYVDVIFQKLEKPAELKNLILIVFIDVVPDKEIPKSHTGKKTKPQVNELESEQQRLKEELQNTLEAVQISEEEHKSSNEELQSMNEELQSTNEELTTSKEELQSMNEELQTVNLELMNKVAEFTAVSDDMKNLLESTEIATLFLTKDLRVRRFTTGMRKIINLLEQDLGRPLTDLASELAYDEFINDMKEVLRTLVFHERQILSKTGLWYRVRIMPYRTSDDVIDGLVLTFTDITALKKLETELQRTISELKSRENT